MLMCRSYSRISTCFYLFPNSCTLFSSDRNECEEWGFCDQKCENVQYSVAVAGAGYKCSCVEGYELREATCQAKLSFPKMNVLFTNTNAVYMVDPTSTRSNSLHEVLANLTSVSGLDFHYKKKLLFYTDVDKRKVFQVRLDETGRHVVAQHKRDYRCVTRDTIHQSTVML